VLNLVRTNRLKPTDRDCVFYEGSEVRVLCVGDRCPMFLCVPIRRYKVGGKESHEWWGCEYVLWYLILRAEASSSSVFSLLARNR
jgi:hypothetical protein